MLAANDGIDWCSLMLGSMSGLLQSLFLNVARATGEG